MIDYSQRGEQPVILDALSYTEAEHQGPCRFLDIGAYDGIRFSNSRALAELGWAGVCVEAAPDAFAALARTYHDRPDILLVNALVEPHDGFNLARVQYSPADALTTTVDEHASLWRTEGAAFRETWMVPLRPGRLLQSFPGPYRLISIDTERTSVAILLGLLDAVGGRLENLGCDVLVVEHDERRNDVIEHCKGYDVRLDNGENLILARPT